MQIVVLENESTVLSLSCQTLLDPMTKSPYLLFELRTQEMVRAPCQLIQHLLVYHWSDEGHTVPLLEQTFYHLFLPSVLGLISCPQTLL